MIHYPSNVSVSLPLWYLTCSYYTECQLWDNRNCGKGKKKLDCTTGRLDVVQLMFRGSISCVSTCTWMGPGCSCQLYQLKWKLLFIWVAFYKHFSESKRGIGTLYQQVASSNNYCLNQIFIVNSISFLKNVFLNSDVPLIHTGIYHSWRIFRVFIFI